MATFHVLYKENTEDYYSKGENIEATDIKDAIEQFYYRKNYQMSDFIIIAVYNTEVLNSFKLPLQ